MNQADGNDWYSYRQAWLAARYILEHLGRLPVQPGSKLIFKDDSTHVEWSLVQHTTENRFVLVIPGSNDRIDWQTNAQFLYTRLLPKRWAEPLQAQIAKLQKQPAETTTAIINDNTMVQPHAYHAQAAEWKSHQVHRGFYNAYEGIKDKVRDKIYECIDANPDTALMVTGHSMGGAVGVFAALDIQFNRPQVPITAYTFGAPRVGNGPFVADYNERVPQTVRVTNGFDIVPTVPPWAGGYRHIERQLQIGRWRWQRGVPRVRDHFLPQYESVLNSLASGEPF